MRRTTLLLTSIFCFAVIAASTTQAIAQTITYLSFQNNVGSGLQSSVTFARLSDGQHGGITVRIESSDPAIALVSDAAGNAGQTFVDIFLPNGSIDALFHVQGLENVTGSADISASAPGFASITSTVTIVQPAFRISALAPSIDTLDPDDNFTVTVGIPNAANTNLGVVQNARGGGPGLTATVTTSDPAIGQLVTSALTGQTVTVQVAPNAGSSPSTVANGGVAFDGLVTGMTSVAATIPGFIQTDAGATDVTVTQPSISFLSFTTTLGAGLQSGVNLARLSAAQHGGVTVRIESTDPSRVLISGDPNSAGGAFADVSVANGSIDALFYIQALESATGSVDVTASVTGFTSITNTTNVVQPALRLEALQLSIDTLDPDDNFQVRVGIPNPTNTNLQQLQNARGGGPGLTATVNSSDPLVGQLVTTASSGQIVTVQVAPNSGTSPSTVTNGGVAHDGLAVGLTTVSATIPGFIQTDAGAIDVAVTQPSISFLSFANIVGAGLQSGVSFARLSASQHGGVTVRIESADPTRVLISGDPNSAGGAFADVSVANGSIDALFYIQALESATGSVDVTASVTDFTSITNTTNVVQPALRLEGLQLSTDTLDPDDNFHVRVGVPNATNTNLQQLQSARGGGPGLTATVNSSDPLVGQLVTTASSGQMVTVQIAPNSGTSPSTVTNGGVAHDGLAAGMTTISATIPGFVQTDAGLLDVTVNADGISFLSFPAAIGAGLQQGAVLARLNSSQHGGVTVTIQSGDPARVLVSELANGAGQTSINVSVPNGQTDAAFHLRAIENVTGTVPITAAAPGFVDGVTNLEVVTPAIEINVLLSTIDVADGSDEFLVRVGLPNASNTALSTLQELRVGSPGVTATLANNTPAVAELMTSSSSGQSITVQIAAGNSASPTTVAGGGVAFVPLGSGNTLVEVTAPNFTQVGSSTRSVAVTNSTIALIGLPASVGAGLQTGSLTARLGESNHGGVTVRIETDEPTVLCVTDNPTTAGTPFVDIFVPNGSTDATFFLVGLNGVVGNATITASAPSFGNRSQQVAVVQPALQILELATLIDATDANDPFVIQVGVPESDNSALREPQFVRAGASALNVTVVTSNPVTGDLVTSTSSGASVVIQIPVGASQTAASMATGGVEFDPLGNGQTIVSASIPNYVTTTAGSIDVEVVGALPAAIQFFSSEWRDDHVTIAWELIDVEGNLEFAIQRREAQDVFRPIDFADVSAANGHHYAFADYDARHGRNYTYRVDVIEDGEYVASFETNILTPELTLALHQNAPNPFNPTTRIKFALPDESDVRLSIYDAKGRLVRNLISERMPIGVAEIVWDGRDMNGTQVGTGVYFYRLKAGKDVLNRKMILLK